MDGHGITASASLGLALEAPRGAVQHASETGKPQQDSSPTSQNHPSKNCLTLLSDALKEDEERPTQLPDITWQAASILLKWHHLTGSGEIAKKNKWPIQQQTYLTHFFGALPLTQQGRRTIRGGVPCKPGLDLPFITAWFFESGHNFCGVFKGTASKKPPTKKKTLVFWSPRFDSG